jgi:hypothetical protein
LIDKKCLIKSQLLFENIQVLNMKFLAVFAIVLFSSSHIKADIVSEFEGCFSSNIDLVALPSLDDFVILINERATLHCAIYDEFDAKIIKKLSAIKLSGNNYKQIVTAVNSTFANLKPHFKEEILFNRVDKVHEVFFNTLRAKVKSFAELPNAVKNLCWDQFKGSFCSAMLPVGKKFANYLSNDGPVSFSGQLDEVDATLRAYIKTLEAIFKNCKNNSNCILSKVKKHSITITYLKFLFFVTVQK